LGEEDAIMRNARVLILVVVLLLPGCAVNLRVLDKNIVGVAVESTALAVRTVPVPVNVAAYNYNTYRPRQDTPVMPAYALRPPPATFGPAIRLRANMNVPPDYVAPGEKRTGEKVKKAKKAVKAKIPEGVK